MVKTNGRGFMGVNDPEPEILEDLLATQSQIPPAPRNKLWAAKSWDISWTSAKSGFRFSQPESANATPKSRLTGILNPTVCLQTHQMLMFIVSKEHYPVYDVNNLYNTNQDFDWGAFRKFAEEMRLSSSSTSFFFFLYQFYDPGTYVLRLSSNQHKKMKYIRILPFGGQCYEEGPFYPTTPGYVVQVGIAKMTDLVLKPDWPAIIGIIIALIFLILIYLVLVILCQAFGWAHEGSPTPQFRKLQLKYNLDKYSSRESKIVVIRKYHSGLPARGCLEKNSNHMERREDQCKLWDSEDLIDLDSFNTNVFFEILLTQSLAVTTKLSQFKEELKSIYFKLLEELASLRDLWVAKMCVPDGGKLCSEVLMGDYMKVKEEAEEEIRCRKHRAAEYEESLNRQINLLTQHLKLEEEHWVAFNSTLQDVIKQVEMLDENISGEELGSNSKPEHRRLSGLIEAAIGKLTSMVVKESHRLTQWGLLGEGTGAGLLNKEKTTVLQKDELVEPGGSLKTESVLHRDLATGLLIPNKDATMLLANRSVKSASPDVFLHSGTGKVLPISGNVGFDPVKSKLIPMVDLASGEIPHRSDLPIFSFVPYPICLETGLPRRMDLPALQLQKVFKFGGLMQDPATGMEVPILAVTAHPQTGQWLTLGGTYLNPLTGMVTPLEIGGPMKAQESGKIVPILGVSLDDNTGLVLPLGGLQGPSGHLLLPGDSFVEPLSGKMARVQGLSVRQGQVMPHAGGYQVLLEANVLLAQNLVIKALREYKDSIDKDPNSMGALPKSLDGPEEAMKTALAHHLDYLTYQLQSLEKQRDGSSRVQRTGGKLGMIKYLSTEFWIPAVFGMKIPDPGNSELMVPILGVECDWKTGQPIPLAGVTEDADGKGLVPITIGFRAIDPITGETGPVIGAQINPWTKAVLPVVQSQGRLPRENIDPDLLAVLARELMARRAYWRSQREKEQEIFKEVEHLSRDILDAAKEGKIGKSWFREKLKAADKICHLLESSSVQESQRQAGRDLTALGSPERSLWSRADKDEKEQEAKVQFLLRKTLEKLAQFVRKTQLEDQRIAMQLKEAERYWSRNLRTQEATREKFRKIKLHLLTEIQQHVKTQRTKLETEYCRLQHRRLLSDIVALQTKDCLPGSSQDFMNYPAARFYSMAATPCGSWEVINKKLIPLLKSVLQTLEENKRGSSSPEEHQESGEAHNSFQDILDLQMLPEPGELVPVLVSSLSGREFVTYQYGIVILQFLRPYIGAPEVELCLASRIPPSKAPGNAFRNTFYYQTPGHQLFVLRESLACAGSFVLLLVHCLAHITANDFNQDSKPAFRRLFYQALKACLGELFSLRLQASAFSEEAQSAAAVINQALQKSEEASAELLSKPMHAKTKGCPDSQKVSMLDKALKNPFKYKKHINMQCNICSYKFV
ncbi:uncharacterized protein [Erythrolamprus reginae]|uniref:uncharacterized protein n=1 Tax=Erythrolamprus reginae TaxID=121349 RepID=UPI00396C4A42